MLGRLHSVGAAIRDPQHGAPGPWPAWTPGSQPQQPWQWWGVLGRRQGWSPGGGGVLRDMMKGTQVDRHDSALWVL